MSVLRCLKSSCFSVLCLENDVLSIVRCVYVGEVKCVYVGGSVVESLPGLGVIEALPLL